MEYFSARNVNPSLYKQHKLPKHLQNILLDLKGDAKILDFGCGFGQNLSSIRDFNTEHKKNFLIQGIDICDEALAFCQNQGLNVEKCDDIFSYFPTRKFDLIIMTHVLEHFPKDQIIPLLTHFREHILEANGKLYVAVPNAQSNTGCYWAYEDFTHHTLFTAGSLFYVSKMSGFSQCSFLDIECLEDSKGIKKWIRILFLKFYKAQIAFWNKITASSFHNPSPQIFSYEIKALLGGGGNPNDKHNEEKTR